MKPNLKLPTHITISAIRDVYADLLIERPNRIPSSIEAQTRYTRTEKGATKNVKNTA